MGDRLATIDMGLGWTEAYLRTKWHLDPSSRLAQQTWAQNSGGCVPLGVELGHHLSQYGLGRGNYFHTKLPSDTWCG